MGLPKSVQSFIPLRNRERYPTGPLCAQFYPCVRPMTGSLFPLAPGKLGAASSRIHVTGFAPFASAPDSMICFSSAVNGIRMASVRRSSGAFGGLPRVPMRIVIAIKIFSVKPFSVDNWIYYCNENGNPSEREKPRNSLAAGSGRGRDHPGVAARMPKRLGQQHSNTARRRWKASHHGLSEVRK